jgi:hypothetical protein
VILRSSMMEGVEPGETASDTVGETETRAERAGLVSSNVGDDEYGISLRTLNSPWLCPCPRCTRARASPS